MKWSGDKNLKKICIAYFRNHSSPQFPIRIFHSSSEFVNTNPACRLGSQNSILPGLLFPRAPVTNVDFKMTTDISVNRVERFLIFVHLRGSN